MASDLFALGYLFCTYLFEYWVVLNYYRRFFPERPSVRRWQYPILIVVCVFLTVFNGVELATLMRLASQILMFVIFVKICFQAKVKNYAFSLMVIFASMVLAEAFSGLLGMFVFPDSYTLFQEFGWQYVLITTFGKVLWFIVVWVSLLSKSNPKYHRASSGKNFLMVVPATLIFFIWRIFALSRGTHETVMDVAIIMLLSFMGTAACIVMFRVYESSLERSELAHQLKQVQDEAIYYDAIVQNETILRSRQHEFLNAMFTAKGLLDEGVEPAAQYLEQLIASFGKDQELAITADFNNKVVNSILNNNKIICREHQIRLELNIEHYDLAFLRPLDTATLLNNAFNNAVEACKQVPEEMERWISLRIYKLHDELVMGMKNAKVNPVILDDGELRSTKPNADFSIHGHGISNMKKCAAQYGGSVHVTEESDAFQLLIRLKL